MEVSHAGQGQHVSMKQKSAYQVVAWCVPAGAGTACQAAVRESFSAGPGAAVCAAAHATRMLAGKDRTGQTPMFREFT